MLRRRTLLGGALAGLGAPRIARGAARNVLRYVPNTDLTLLDPVWTAAFVTRIHGLMVYDTLYGQDDAYVSRPQMVEGQRTEDGGRTWRLTLREGLLFHDGTPMLARDVVASLRRWGRVDAFGQSLLARTDELSAPSDSEVLFRLKTPFPLLPDALGKSTAYLPAIMPARIAEAAGSRLVTEVVGSGPFRYVKDERVDGIRTVYAKFDGYVPRQGVPQYTSGPKVAYLDRVEWQTMPDEGTAANALRTAQIEWLERPLIDLLPILKRDSGIVLDIVDKTGYMPIIRFNQLHPPFDNPGVRRAMLGAIWQADIMNAVAGADPSLWQDKVGVFCPESPMASDEGLEVLSRKPDYAQVKRNLDAAGYAGERVVFLSSSNNPAGGAVRSVATDQFVRSGLNVEVSESDFGTWLQRRNSKEPPSRGGWNCTTTFLPGQDLWDPAVHLAIRGNGQAAWSGWPSSPELERLRDAWFGAPDMASRQAICRDIQRQVWVDVPYIPGGRWRHPTAYRAGITGVLRGMPLFHNVRLPQ